MHTNQTGEPTGAEPTRLAQDFSPAERDALGFVRRGSEETPLDAWARLLNGASRYDTSESEAIRTAIEKANKERKPRDRIPVGFGMAKGSEAWNDAQRANATLIALSPPKLPAQGDLFAEPLVDVERFAVDEEQLARPKAFGGPPPEYDEIADGCEYDGVGLAIAWDDERILVTCPRGACLIPRNRWAEGYRRCPGC